MVFCIGSGTCPVRSATFGGRGHYGSGFESVSFGLIGVSTGSTVVCSKLDSVEGELKSQWNSFPSSAEGVNLQVATTKLPSLMMVLETVSPSCKFFVIFV